MSLFTNATEVRINNKVVQSIKTENATIYEKPVDNTIIYENLSEQSNNGGWNVISTNINLPNSFEITVDLYTEGLREEAEQRLYLCPTRAYTENQQPSFAVWVGFNREDALEWGTREYDRSNWHRKYQEDMLNKYHSFKIKVIDTHTEFYANDTLLGTDSNMLDESETGFILCTVNWATGNTFKWKNLRIRRI